MEDEEAGAFWPAEAFGIGGVGGLGAEEEWEEEGKEEEARENGLEGGMEERPMRE